MRVLHVLNGLGSGGVESLLLNWYKNIDRDKIQFDFLIRSNQIKNKELIESMGGNIHVTPSYPRHFLKNYKETKRLLETKKWNVVHVHANSAFYISVLIAAKRVGVPCRIMHSHSISASNKIASIIHSINKRFINRYATHKWACSKAAGEWMFTDENFEVLNNAINTNKFKFSSENREEIRKEFGLENKFVIGHVGRFNKAKNHYFLVDVFKEVKKEKSNAVLFLVGEGELFTSIKEYVNQQGLSDSVIFAGVRNDVGKIMSAMDVFVFPSVYEGLGIVLIEAQTNGLQCVVSEKIPCEVAITNLVNFVSLSQNCSEWSRIIKSSLPVENRSKYCNLIVNNEYELSNSIKKLEEFYFKYNK